MLRLAMEPSDEPEPKPRSAPGWLGLLLALLGPRGTLAALLAVLVLALSLLAVSGLPSRLSGWVHQRPEYAWNVDEVVLDPPPPPWLPGGRDALIESASRTLADASEGSAIGLPLDAVVRAFKNARWVDRVLSVRRSYPDRITVSLRYRGRPVALAEFPGPDGPTDHVIDESAALLAESSRLGLEEFGPLIRLNGIEPPPDPDPGSSWTLPDSPSEPNPIARAASRLARFLREQVDEHGPPTASDGRAVQILEIQPLHRASAVATLKDEGGTAAPPSDEAIRDLQSRTLYVRLALPNGTRFWVRWLNAPGAEDPDTEPDAREKMAMLRDWLSNTSPPPAPFPEGALVFTRREAVWRKPL